MELASTYDLDDEQTSSLMNNVQQYVKRLRELAWEMEEAEENFKKAKAAYENFSRKTVPDIFKLNGVDSIVTETGQKVAVVTKTACSVNRANKQLVTDWLRKRGADTLVKESLTVPISEIKTLENSGVSFEKVTDVNTNALKAYLLGELGQKGAPATLSVEEIPESISFFQWDEMEITEV